MKLYFIMGNTEVCVTHKGGKQYRTFIPSSILMSNYSDYYKPITIYGTKRKRSRKESK